jgi:hypothetical protein
MDNVQNCDSYVKVPSSRIYRTYFPNLVIISIQTDTRMWVEAVQARQWCLESPYRPPPNMEYLHWHKGQSTDISIFQGVYTPSWPQFLHLTQSMGFWSINTPLTFTSNRGLYIEEDSGIRPLRVSTNFSTTTLTTYLSRKTSPLFTLWPDLIGATAHTSCYYSWYRQQQHHTVWNLYFCTADVDVLYTQPEVAEGNVQAS